MSFYRSVIIQEKCTPSASADFFVISSVRKEDYYSVNVENVQSKETYEDATAVKMEMVGEKILKSRDAYNRPQTLFD